MKLEVLISTMNQDDIPRLMEQMNIQTDAIVINQCDFHGYDEFLYRGNRIKCYSFQEKGIGLSRNTALMRTKADLVLFADDDAVYCDGYPQTIISAFQTNSRADIIIFNLPGIEKERFCITKERRVRLYNCFRFGGAQTVAKVDRIRKKNICFSLLFGGGAKYSAGEDSLFYARSIQAGLRIYMCREEIGKVHYYQSSWFQGYNEKYFYDKGAFYACFSSRLAKILCIQDTLRHAGRTKDGLHTMQTIKIMFKGIKEYRRS